MDKGAWWARVHRVAESEATQHACMQAEDKIMPAILYEEHTEDKHEKKQENSRSQFKKSRERWVWLGLGWQYRKERRDGEICDIISLDDGGRSVRD